MIETQKYLRKPLYVDAVRITGANFEEIAAWCQGEILHDEAQGTGPGKKYIRVRVHNPKNPRQTKAYVGDWLLYTERGYKVYTAKAFHMAFDLVADDAPLSDSRLTGDPVADATAEEQPIKPHVIEEAELHSSNGVAEIDITTESVTPEHATQAVLDNEAAREAAAITEAVGEAETAKIVEASPSITAGAQALREKAGAVSEKIEPEAVAGKRVLSIQEQSEMTPDGIRDLVQSGEAVLIQDVNA